MNYKNIIIVSLLLITYISKSYSQSTFVAEAMSCIQRSKSYNFVVDFDINEKNIDLTNIEKIFPKFHDSKFKTPYKILETKGGHHLMIYPQYATEYLRAYNSQVFSANQLNLNWYKSIIEMFLVDQNADQMIPIPGTTQGSFIPKFIEI